MKKILLISLGLILALALLLMGATFVLNKVAMHRAQEEHIALMETLLPGGKDFVKVSYTLEDSLIRSVHRCDKGYVIETATTGYAGEVIMLIGVDNEGHVTGLVTRSAHETPGLGSRILTDHKFLSQFLNKSGSFTLDAPQSDGFSGATQESTSTTGNEIQVDGISGATVSSKAVVRCVNAAVAYVTGTDVDSSASTWGG